MQNPWKTLSTKPIYDNPWISVREDQIINPAGNPGIYGVISFKNTAIGIIPVDSENNTWLVGQYRYALQAYSWEIPMGGCPLSEDNLSGAQRELKEETGLIAQKWQEIMCIHPSNSVSSEQGFVYLAQELTQLETEHEETEVLEIKKLPLKQAVDMVLTGEITDAISVAGLLKVGILLKLL